MSFSEQPRSAWCPVVVVFFRWVSADSFLQIGSVHVGLPWAGAHVLPEGSRIRLSALLEILLLPELC